MKKLLDTPFEIAFLRWSMVLIFVLFGYAKWFEYEAQALIPLLSHSPILSWMHVAFGVQGASYALGVAEWTIGLGLIAGAWLPRVSVLASAGSAITFLTTLTLVFSTPGAWEASAGGFPAMGGATSFLIKDLILLGASLVLLKDSLRRVVGQQCESAECAGSTCGLGIGVTRT